MFEHAREDQLQAYLDGELDEAKRQDLEAHLRTCQECRDAMAQWERLFTQLESIGELQMSRSVAPQVVAEVRAELSRRRRLSWFVRLEILAVITLALALESRGLLSQGLGRLFAQIQALEPVSSIVVENLRLEALGQWATVVRLTSDIRSDLMTWQPASLPEAPWMAILLAATLLGLIGNGLLLGRQLQRSTAGSRVAGKEANHG